MGGEYCPYCGNSEGGLLTYITKDAEHDSYQGRQTSISIIVCERCERWFRVVSNAGAPETCLKWEDMAELR